MFKNEQLFGEAACAVLQPSMEAILWALFRHRRLRSRCACSACLAPHLDKVRHFVAAGEPIQLVLPAFPAKSPSPKKVLGKLPDLAEELALRHLQTICDQLQRLYAPGARVLICSDGRVFSDLVGVSPEDVALYGRALSAQIAALPSLASFSDDDYARYRAPPPDDRVLWSGIQRFLFEDRVVLEPHKSRSQVRRECGLRAWEVMARSAAWSRLIAERFPHALRLSIHPQPPHSDKIGIRLGDSDEGWLTPWHAVAVKRGGRFLLMHRHQAEALGGRLVERHGLPSHFELEAAA